MRRKSINSYVVNACVFEKYFKAHYNSIVDGDINKYTVGELLEKTYAFIPNGEVDDDGCPIDVEKLVEMVAGRVEDITDLTEVYKELEGNYVKNPEVYIDSIVDFRGMDFMAKKRNARSLYSYIENVAFNVILELIINKKEVVD